LAASTANHVTTASQATAQDHTLTTETSDRPHKATNPTTVAPNPINAGHRTPDHTSVITMSRLSPIAAQAKLIALDRGIPVLTPKSAAAPGNTNADRIPSKTTWEATKNFGMTTHSASR
jgi:hypothetical protein